MEALLLALGALFASWPGVLLLAVAAAMIVITWNWRIALGLLVLLYVGVGSLLVRIHQAPGWLVGGYLVAMFLSVAILALATRNHGPSPSQRHTTNWPVRTLTLAVITTAWWFIDPGLTIPQFSRPETDLLFWIGICGLVILSLSTNPTYVGIGLLMWLAPVYAVATVLLPGSGVAPLVGIAALLVALACGYLALLEPVIAGAKTTGWRRPISPTASLPPAPAGMSTLATAQMLTPASEPGVHLEASK